MDRKQTDILTEVDALHLANKYKIPVADFRVCESFNDAIAYSKELKFPLTVKGVVEGVSHKSDLGLVNTNIKSDEAFIKAIEDIQNKSRGLPFSGFLLQSHIFGKREIIVGGMKHADYGICVYIGLGGVFVEAIEDVSFRSMPISKVDLQEMINELKCRKMFGAFRGEPPVDMDMLFQTIKAIENLLSNEPEISHFELNPLLIQGETPIAVDALAITNHHPISDTKEEETIVFNFDRFLKLFEPKSIAFVGITNSQLKWGFRVPFNTLEGGYKGKIYGVNPKRTEVLDIPCYPSIMELPETVDLAVIIVPPPAVYSCVQDCADKGIKTVLVITAGFGELNDDKAKMAQDELKQLAKKYGLYLIGPNCAGVISPDPMALCCTMFGGFPEAGKLSILSQSGNIGETAIGWAKEHKLGIARFISTGNEAVIKNSNYLKFFGSDPKTKVIYSYIENAKGIKNFYSELKEVSKKKPVIVMKGGRTEEGSRAASSHTGALATDYRLFKGICVQNGGILVEDIYEVIETAHLLANLPLPRGRKTGILSQGGGWGVICADACATAGLNVVQLSESTLQKLDKVMPEWWNRINPVDMVAGTDVNLFRNALEILVQDESIDLLIVLGIGYISNINLQFQYSNRARSLDIDKLAEIGTSIELRDVEEIANLIDTYKKPIFLASDLKLLSQCKIPNPIFTRLEELNIYVFPNPLTMAKVIVHLCQYSEYLQQQPRKF